MTEKLKTGFAALNASLVWALQPFVAYQRKLDDFRFFLDGNVFVEPCAEGGAIIVATSSHAMVAIRDPDGSCSAPMTLSLPDDLFDALAPRPPIDFNYCGEQYACPLPEWARPGTLYVYGAGLHVVPKMRHPDWAEEEDEFWPCLYSARECGNHHHIGRDYKWTDGVGPLDWRKPFAATPDLTAATHIFRPELATLFSRFETLWSVDRPTPRFFFRPSKDDGPIMVTAEGQPDFVGMLMPMASGDYQTPPSWIGPR